eukprot:14755-Rhodomonas_salina.1
MTRTSESLNAAMNLNAVAQACIWCHHGRSVTVITSLSLASGLTGRLADPQAPDRDWDPTPRLGNPTHWQETALLYMALRTLHDWHCRGTTVVLVAVNSRHNPLSGSHTHCAEKKFSFTHNAYTTSEALTRTLRAVTSVLFFSHTAKSKASFPIGPGASCTEEEVCPV